MISSVSVYSSYALTQWWVDNGLIKEAYNSFYIEKTLKSAFVAFVAFAIVVKIDYRFFEKYAKWWFIGSVLSLIVVLRVAETRKGANGWIDIAGFSIQPTEFAKLALIILLALFLKKYKTHLRSVDKGLLPFLGILGVMVLPIAAQPDFGTLIIMIPVATMMFFFAGANMKHLLWIAAIGIISIMGLYVAGDYDKETGKSTNTLWYITRRIDNFLFDAGDDVTDAGYQNEQALVAIGSWGFSGRGLWGSIQKFWYLPEAQGDFIFSIIIEELGFLGGFTLMLLYMFIWYRALYVANNVKDLFGKYVALGIGAWIVFQAFVNIGVNLSLLPNTGITLPFVSYGGSSLLALMIALWILLSISRHMEAQPEYNRLKNKKFLF